MDKITIKIFIPYLPLQAAVATRFEKIRSERSAILDGLSLQLAVTQRRTLHICRVFSVNSIRMSLQHIRRVFTGGHDFDRWLGF